MTTATKIKPTEAEIKAHQDKLKAAIDTLDAGLKSNTMNDMVLALSLVKEAFEGNEALYGPLVKANIDINREKEKELLGFLHNGPEQTDVDIMRGIVEKVRDHLTDVLKMGSEQLITEEEEEAGEEPKGYEIQLFGEAFIIPDNDADVALIKLDEIGRKLETGKVDKQILVNLQEIKKYLTEDYPGDQTIELAINTLIDQAENKIAKSITVNKPKDIVTNRAAREIQSLIRKHTNKTRISNVEAPQLGAISSSRLPFVDLDNVKIILEKYKVAAANDSKISSIVALCDAYIQAREQEEKAKAAATQKKPSVPPAPTSQPTPAPKATPDATADKKLTPDEAYEAVKESADFKKLIDIIRVIKQSTKKLEGDDAGKKEFYALQRKYLGDSRFDTRQKFQELIKQADLEHLRKTYPENEKNKIIILADICGKDPKNHTKQGVEGAIKETVGMLDVIIAQVKQYVKENSIKKPAVKPTTAPATGSDAKKDLIPPAVKDLLDSVKEDDISKMDMDELMQLQLKIDNAFKGTLTNATSDRLNKYAELVTNRLVELGVLTPQTPTPTPAPTPTPTPAPSPEPKAPKPIEMPTDMPDELKAIAIEALPDKDDQKRFAVLWSKYKEGAMTLEAADQKKVKTSLDFLLSKNSTDKKKAILRSLVPIIKKIDLSALPKSKEEQEKDEQSELKALLENITLLDPELTSRISELFDILSDNPDNYKTLRDKKFIIGLQSVVKTVLYDEIPSAITGKQTLKENLAEIEKLDFRKQTGKAVLIESLLDNDKELNALLNHYRGLKNPSGQPPASTPPSSPPPVSAKNSTSGGGPTPAPGYTQVDLSKISEDSIENIRPMSVVIGEMIKGLLMDSSNYKENDPVCMAIYASLKNLNSYDLQKVREYLSKPSGGFNEVVQGLYNKNTSAQLQSLLVLENRKLEKIQEDLKDARERMRTASHSRTPVDTAKLQKEIDGFSEQKNKQEDYIRCINVAISGTMHYKSPQQILGMINQFHNPKKTAPDILKMTNEQIEVKRIQLVRERGKLNKVIGIFRRNLHATLVSLTEDGEFKEIKPEDWKKFLKCKDIGSVKRWINKYKGQNPDMLPKLIAYLGTGMLNGKTTYFNTANMGTAERLLTFCKKIQHEEITKEVLKTGQTTIDGMNAYFDKLNSVTLNENDISLESLKKKRYSAITKVGLTTLGIGATIGGIALVGPLVGLAAQIGISGAGVATGGLAAKMHYRDKLEKKGDTMPAEQKQKAEKRQQIANKIILRSALGGAMAIGAGLAGGAVILPLLAGAAGIFSPEICKKAWSKISSPLSQKTPKLNYAHA